MLKKWTGTSPSTATTSISSTIITGLDAFESMKIVTVLQGGTGGTLDVYLQMSDDPDGTVWIDYAHFTQLADGAAQQTRLYSVSRQTERLTAIQVAIGDTPALAAGTVLGGEFGAKMRVITVAGAGTSAGAPQTIYFIGSPARRRV
jgi:hypothetical protein